MGNDEFSLARKAVRGTVWVFGVKAFTRVFSLIRTIILARLLSPTDFGLFGIALLTLMTLDTFSQTGFLQALIQKKKDIHSYLNSAWTVSILRGIFLFLILFLIAPYVALFFEASEAKWIIQVIAISFLFQGFINIGVVYFQKELQFRKYFIFEASGALLDFVVAVTAALLYRNVWALVFGILAGQALKLVISYFIHPFKPKLDFNLTKAKELFTFGKWIFGSSILIFLITQGDDIFVGKFLGIMMLGYYQLAFKFANLPTTEITYVISQVAFPTYAKLQHSIKRLRAVYVKILQIVAFLSFFTATLIIVFAKDFTLLFLGDKWSPIIFPLQILCAAGLFRSLMATTGPVLKAVNKPHYETKWQFVRLLILGGLITYFTFRWNIAGTSFSVLLANVLGWIGLSNEVLKITNCKFFLYIKMIIYPLVISTCIGTLLFFIKSFVVGISFLNLLILLLIGCLLFFIAIYILNNISNYKLLDVLSYIFKEIRGNNNDRIA